MTKELSVKMHMYMEYEGDKVKEELESKFEEMVYEFSKEKGLDYQIHETDLQEV